MAKKKQPGSEKKVNANAEIENAGLVLEQPITETLEKNYMPYAMSVIVSRAIPQIDGFKPSHRKILYTMYKMGLLTGARTKSANVVGQTMKLNPHGDAAIYETMVRLARGNEALLYPYVDSKGNFGKAYSRDMAYAASRYTEVKLDAIGGELFRDIDKNTVDFVDNYDNTQKEPLLLPVTFPSILVNSNVGIAVGMASSICPFNLSEVCETTIALMKNPEHKILSTLIAPDFPGGGFVVYNEHDLRKIYKSGRGSVRVRCRYIYDKQNNCIEVSEIPPSTTVEAIMDKIIDLIKQGKIREISDIRDETDLSGLKLAIDLKRGVDAEKLMAKLLRMTPLEDNFSCNFNVLIDGVPRVMGVRELLNEWISFRTGCVRRRTVYDLKKKQEKMHLLEGLSKILLDIDKAIRIIRETKLEEQVIQNLMEGFSIDKIQAEYVAEIKLRHLNEEYILKCTREIDSLKATVEEMQSILADERKLGAIIIAELKDVAKKYGKPRKTLLVYPSEEEMGPVEDEVPDYPVWLFLSKEGYFKKITPQSLRMSSDQKLKDGDVIVQQIESSNTAELLFFTNQSQVYKSRASEFDDTKASVFGEYIPAKLGFDEGETVEYLCVTKDYGGHMLFFFQNGKIAKVPLNAYWTKTKRKKLLNAYYDKVPLAAIHAVTEEQDFVMQATSGRILILHSDQVSVKTAKNTQGIQIMRLRRDAVVSSVDPYTAGQFQNEDRFRLKNIPSAGQFAKDGEVFEQLKL
ncbi:DNA gyrase/topoisomerase IV subunit A [Candidatus Soleaferrea massiliensis]|uniref:DNA gyrase/topoisomerase IV subunit A n=1 Tax=Candidatus Soleaferrea massiliensis TaxID=1470354 RepID=UPI00058EB6B9|nr:DNA topoisomerase (ATP-hydrolyzing) subunit A [Candidatus Soleaferrea massiliensis]